MTTPTTSEMLNRERKSRKMACFLHSGKLTSLEVPPLSNREAWGHIAAGANCAVPHSEETRKLVIEILQEMEKGIE
jgi:hypothetical protein